MTEIYFQKMTPEGYHEIELQIEELKKERPTKIARLKACLLYTSPSPRDS